MKKKVSTIVVVNNKEFLILRRGKFSPGSGAWNFPGGGVENGEEYPQAAVRELKEEANLDVNLEDVKYLGTLETRGLIIKFFITKKYSGEVAINKESDKFKWIELKDIEKYRFVSGGSLHPNLVFEIGKFIYGV